MGKQKKILIAEDEKPLSHALSLKLTNEGFDVVVVQNGNECLELLQKEHYDVLLLDLMMPVIDGFQVLEELRHKSDSPYVIVLSNLSQREDEERVMSLGAKGYFTKSNTSLATIVSRVKSI